MKIFRSSSLVTLKISRTIIILTIVLSEITRWIGVHFSNIVVVGVNIASVVVDIVVVVHIIVTVAQILIVIIIITVAIRLDMSLTTIIFILPVVFSILVLILAVRIGERRRNTMIIVISNNWILVAVVVVEADIFSSLNYVVVCIISVTKVVGFLIAEKKEISGSLLFLI